jgi:integrase
MSNDGSGTIYKRGAIWWVKIRANGRPHYESSKSTKKTDAVRLRDKLLGERHRGTLSTGQPDTVLMGELLDDLMKLGRFRPNTRYIIDKVIQRSIRPFFGRIKASRLTTDLMDEYRTQRKAQGRSDTTVNRELSYLRMAFHNARKRTPPKVIAVPYFPMVTETNIRKGFLTDAQYAALKEALPEELKALFVTAYLTGMRKGELLAIRWAQVDFDTGLIALEKDETKNDEARNVPILRGDMRDLLLAAKAQCDGRWPNCAFAFSRSGLQIRDFRRSWREACVRASVPELNFHDLRRTAVRNMRRAGVPQVVRMKISGHKTDSMERRYNIVDTDDISVARALMEQRLTAPENVTKTVTTPREIPKPGDSALLAKSAT